MDLPNFGGMFSQMSKPMGQPQQQTQSGLGALQPGMGQSNPMQSAYQAYGQSLQAQQPMQQPMGQMPNSMQSAYQAAMNQQMGRADNAPMQQDPAYANLQKQMQMLGGMPPSNPMQQSMGQPLGGGQQDPAYGNLQQPMQNPMQQPMQNPMQQPMTASQMSGMASQSNPMQQPMQNPMQQPMRSPMMPQAPTAQQVRPEAPRMQAMRNMQRMKGYNR